MNVIDKIKGTVSATGKFMARYADEASDVADVFRRILPALPLNRADRDRIADVVDRLDSVADGVTEFLKSNPDVGAAPVVVRQSDVKKAVEAYLKDNPVTVPQKAIDDAVKAALEKVGNGSKGNA